MTKRIMMTMTTVSLIVSVTFQVQVIY